MRFLQRALGGAGLLAICAILAFLGARPYLGCAPALSGLPGLRCALDQPSERASRRSNAERVFVVRAETVSLGVETPLITAFGEVRSGRTLEIRALASGRLVAVDEAFEDGGVVSAGQRLFVIDPALAQSARDEAAALLAEARAESSNAERSLALAESTLRATSDQRDLQAKALERQRSLRERGIMSEATIETAELSLADAERAVLTAEQALAAEAKRVEQSALAVERAGIALADAERTLNDTAFEAPFAGILQDVTAVLGRLVATNEQLGSLIDPAAIQVGFRVSDAEFSRMLDARGALIPLDVTATLSLGDRTVDVKGQIDRVAATVTPAEGGRLVFARLEFPEESVLRPGDFVTVEIREAPIENVARLPAGAVDASGQVLILGEDGRLATRNVALLRRQGANVLVRGEIDGEAVVVERTPQLGPGVKARRAGDAAAEPADDMVALEPEQRERLLAFVRESKRMPDDRRERLLTQLAQPSAPRAVIERLQARMERRARRTGSN